MPDIGELLRQTKEGDEKTRWAAVQTLIHMRPTTEEEKKARAYACVYIAESLSKQDKIGTSIDWYQDAINCDPLNVDYRLGLAARALLRLGMKRQALNEADRALNLDRTNPKAWRLVGHIQMELGNVDEATEAFDKYIELASDDTSAVLDRNDLALETCDWETVENNCKKLLALNGSHRGNALHQLGLLAFRTGRHEEAIKLWDETLEHECDHRETVLFNQAMALLAVGQYRRGWRAHEARGTQQRDAGMAFQTHRGMGDRLFYNEPPPARLHAFQEMGFGDAICMARYLPLLVEKGYDVRFECMPSLVDLIQYSMPDVKVMPRAAIFPGLLGVPEFDYIVPALSLPRLFGTEVATIPWSGPYLRADPKKVAEYRAKLGNGKIVGVCWSAGIRTGNGLWLEEYGKRKSVSAENLHSIIDGIYLLPVSLQVGPERKNNPFFDVLPKKPSWADTAALIECCDLVISVDTGLAHLVGALGKPLWLLMHTEGSWHWMAERPGASWNETGAWYPSARLFRAKKPHQWDDVIEAVAAELENYRRQ